VAHIILSVHEGSVRVEAERTVSLALPRASGLSFLIGHVMKNLAA
jgi:hypothetical protein